jgi:hypothetical protein
MESKLLALMKKEFTKEERRVAHASLVKSGAIRKTPETSLSSQELINLFEDIVNAKFDFLGIKKGFPPL